MVIAGSVLALLCGVLNSVAAALEKHEGASSGAGLSGLRLLGRLARQPRWLLAIALSALAWVAEAASLVMAPIPAVATGRGAGRGVLVPIGHYFLHERFHKRELAGVVLAIAGGGMVAAAAVVGGAGAIRPPLPVGELLAVGAAVAVATALVSRWRTGLGLGAAVGLLFAATGVYTKEIGDHIGVYGPAGVVGALAGPSLWVMLVFSVWAQSLLQAAFRRTNAANVAATNATVSAAGLVAAGYGLYHEPFPRGWSGVPLVAGLLISLVGVALLAASGSGREAPAPPPTERVGGPESATD